jgi:signal transduction histidine kinase
VAVGITADAGSVRINVDDDGRGPPASGVDQLEREGHMGLAGMRERISALGGSVRFGRSRGRGAALEIVLPVEPSPEVAAP